MNASVDNCNFETSSHAIKMYSPRSKANQADFERAEERLKKIDMITQYRKEKIKSVIVNLKSQVQEKEQEIQKDK